VDEVSRFYDDFANYQLTYLQGGNPRHDAIHRRLRPMIRQRRPRRALDVGCGIGLTVRWLAPLVTEAVGVDISPRNVEIARRLVPDASFTVASVSADPLPAGPFDLVTMLDVVEHFPPNDRPRVFQAVGEVISSDGVLVVNVPSKLFAVAHGEDEGRQVIDEAIGVDELVALAAVIGMEPLLVDRYGIEFENQYAFAAFARWYEVSVPVRMSRRERVLRRASVLRARTHAAWRPPFPD
jgi:2-polyprenyl-3-methyl-5-hydroxy-6-metoxy-1,4-benzoquinol methylase